MKRFFKVFGIVLGLVIALVGGVVGVMALMGKFTTPDVYPTILKMENQIRIVDKYIQLDDYKKSDLYYFVITGENTDEEYAEFEVNKKTCYIWFDGNVGSTLIQLCDENGNALVPINGRYKVECNTPIYYKVVPLIDVDKNQNANIANLDGKVVLQARHENDSVQTNKMTIWIDREISSVSFKDEENLAQIKNGRLEQTVQIGTDKQIELSYIINPEKSLLPISSETEKIVELYFDDKNDEGTDLVPVNDQTIVTNETLSKMFKMGEDNKLYFYVDSTIDEPLNTNGDYDFIIATFPTYQAKEEFDADENNKNLTYFQRVNKMLTTSLFVNVVNSNITSIDVNSTGLSFTLYSESDYITLNEEGVDDANAKNNNLELLMYIGDESINVRYSEANFGGYSVKELSNDDLANLVFKEKQLELEVNYSVLTNGRDLSECVQESNVSIVINNEGDLHTYTIIDYFKDIDFALNENKYYCTSGVMVKDSANKFYILKSGVYLDFYVESGDQYTVVTQAEFDYSVEYVNGTYGANKTWKVVSKKTIENSIYAGVLVINNNGNFNQDDLFKKVEIQVSEKEISYSMPNSKVEIDVNYDKNADGETVLELEGKEFSELITDVSGSYNALAFLLKKEDFDADYNDVEVLWEDAGSLNGEYDAGEEIVLNYNSVDYLIVGSFDADGYFVNKVQLINDGNVINGGIKLYVVQFKNNYNQTVESILKEPVEVEDILPLIKEVFEDHLTVTPKLNLNIDSLTITHSAAEQAGVYKIYEGQTGSVRIESDITDMIRDIFDFYSLLHNHGNYFSSNNSNLRITSVYLDGESILINYETTAYSDEDVYITLSGLVAEDYQIGPIRILNSAPEKIVYRYGEGTNDYVELAGSTEDALMANYYIGIEVNKAVSGLIAITAKFKSSGSSYDLYLKPSDNPDVTGKAYASYFADNYSGFMDGEGFKTEHKIEYAVLDDSAIYISTIGPNPGDYYGANLFCNRQGSTVLKVTFAGTNKDAFIRVQTEVAMYDGENAGFKFEVNGVQAENNNEYTYEKIYNGILDLSDFVNIAYVEGASEDNLVAQTDRNQISIENLAKVSYGPSELYSDEYEDSNEKGYWLKDRDGAVVFRIYHNITGDLQWKIKKEANLYIPLTVSFDVVCRAVTLRIKLALRTEIAVNFNDAWKDGVIYQGTTVKLVEQAGYNIATSKFDLLEHQAIIQVLGTSSTVKVKICKNGTETETTSDYTFSECGDDYELKVYIGGSLYSTFTNINVIPNIIATKKEVVVLKSNTTGSLSDIFDFKSFNTYDTYGESGKSYYDGNGILNPNLDSAAADIAKLTISSEATNKINNPLVSSSNGTYSIDWLYNVDTVINAGITLKYTEGDYEYNYKFKVSNVEHDCIYVDIKNQYSVVPDTSSIISQNIQTTEIDNKTYYKLMAYTEYENFANISGFNLVSVKYGEKEVYDGTNGIINIEDIISSDQQTQLLFTYNNGSYDLEYEMPIILLPYAPKSINPTDVYTSQVNFDLLNEVIDISNIPADIKSITVQGVYLNKTNVAEDITNNNYNGGYYINNANSNCYIDIKDDTTINGLALRESIFNVKYKITYINDVEYEFYAPLTIKNRQTIKVYYPEDKSRILNNVQMYFNEANVASGGYFNAGALTINNQQFEPVLINQDVTLDFAYDDFKKMSRIKIVDVYGSGSTEIAKISVVGCSNNPSIKNYSNRIAINGSKVTLPSSNGALSGNIVLKITTESGNFEYYYIYVYYDNANRTYQAKNIEYSTNNLGGLDLAISSNFESSYTSLNTKLYVLSATALGNNSEYILSSSNPRYSYIESLGSLNTDSGLTTNNSKYITLVISIVYTGADISIQYCIGTATIYLSPTSAENITTPVGIDEINKLNESKDTGIYVATINNNATLIDCPFDAGYTVEIISQEGSTATCTGGQICLTRVLDNDYKFIARYTRDSDGLVIEVQYTYKATVLPKNGNIKDIGKFDGTKFVKEFEVKETTKTTIEEIKKDITALLGNYNGGYDIVCRDGVEFDDVDLLTFTLGTNRYTTSITITYTDLGEVSRTFSFDVNAGYYVNSTGNNGTNSNNKFETDINPTNLYTSRVGSTLTFSRSSEANYYLYEIGGYKIYIDKADADNKLILSFDEIYTLGSAANNAGMQSSFEVSNGSGDYTINFVHLAENKSLTMNIIVSDGSGNEYEDLSFYIMVAKTYSGLVSKYVTKDSDHENIKAGDDIYTLYNLFCNDILVSPEPSFVNNASILNSKRLCLVDLSNDEVSPTDVNFENMGFNAESNPNKLQFGKENSSVAQLLDSDTKIQFTNAGSTTVFVYNNAGIAENNVNSSYKFIVWNDAADVITLTSDYMIGENTITNNTYISYTGFEDQQELMVGTIADATNNGFVFLVNNVKCDGNTVSDVTVVLGEESDSYYKIYTMVHSGYTLNLTYKKDHTITTQLTGEVADGSQVTFTISLFGVSSYVVENLELVFSNISVSSNYESSLDRTVNGGTYVDLKGKIAGIDDNDIALELITEKSSFTNGGTKNTDITDLVTYTNGSKQMYVKHVGAEEVEAVLVFNVKYKGISVKTVTYKFKVNLNIKLVINNNDAKDVVDYASTFQLNYYNPSNNFPLTYNFETTEESVSVGTSPTLYKNFVVKVYRPIDDYGDESFEEISSANLEYSLVSAETSTGKDAKDYVIVNGTQIAFYKDFNGLIVLKVTYSSGGFSYSIDWNITVKGLIVLEYANGESSKIQNGVSSFKSGSKVDLIDEIGSTSNSVGVKMSRAGANAQNSGTYEDITVNLAIKAKYIKTDGYSDWSNSELFNNKAIDIITYPSNTLTNSSVEITLPSVPASTTNEIKNYYVIYEIKLAYMNGLDTSNIFTFYVAYQVNNVLDIIINNSAVVDMDNGLENGKKELVLFYYSESENLKHYTSGDIYSLFTNGFNSIDNFKKFVETITAVKIGEYTYATDRIVVIVDGNRKTISELKTINGTIDKIKVNVDISNPDGEGAYIENELIGDFVVVCDGVDTIKVKAWSSEYTNGFKLTTENKLQAKGSKKVSELFTDISNENIFNVSGSVAIKDLRNFEIVGINNTASPNAGWVYNANFENGDLVATIKIKSSANSFDLTYDVYSATYTGTGEVPHPLYKLTKTFYYITAADAEIFTYNYFADGSSNRGVYEIAYGKTAVPLKAFEVYVCDTTNGIVSKTITVSDLAIEEDSGTDADDSSIYIASDKLIEYKALNPGEDVYKAEYTVTYDEKTIYVYVEFGLPNLQTKPKTYDTAGVEASVLFDGKTFGGFNLTDVVSVSAGEGFIDYFSNYNQEDGKITLNVDKLNYYFTTYNYTFIDIKLVMEVEGESETITYEFFVRVNKP